MTAFSDAADKHAGETPIVLVSFTDGSTTYRWSTVDVFDDTNNVFYDGRIVSTGQIDRPVSSAMPPLATFSIVVSNADSGLDSLFSDYSSFSPIDATVTVKRGFSSIAVADFQDVCVMVFDGVPRLTGDRMIEINFSDNPSRQFGEIVSPRAQDVFNAMTAADGVLWPANTQIPGADLTVPVVLGHYPLNGRYDGVDAPGRHFDHGGALGGYTFPGQCRIVAIGYTAFDTATNRLAVIYDDGVMSDGRIGSSRGVPNSTVTWGQEEITLNGATWYVLVYKVTNTIQRAGGFSDYSPMVQKWRVSVRPNAPDKVAADEWRIAEFIKGACVSGDKFTSWAAQADAASWSSVNEHTGTRVRKVVKETTPVSTIVGEALEQCFVYAYATRSGKFAGLWIEPIGGPAPDYSGKVALTEEDDFLSFEAEIPNEGEFSMANVIVAHFAEKALVGTDLGARIAESHIEGKELGLILAPDSITVENSAAITRHNSRRVSSDVGGRLIYNRSDAVSLAERESDIRSDPRAMINADLPWSASSIELGDIVRVTHSAIPGWSADRLCVVFGIVDDFVAGVVNLTLVDFHSLLGAKVCYYDTIEDWEITDYADESITAAITNGSSNIVFSASGNWEEALEGDIFEIVDGSNEFQVVISSVTAGSSLITLYNTGGEDGPQNTAYTTDGTVTGWRILRGQSNRATSTTNYTEQDPKYGCYAVGADGFFRDDSTAAYVFQR